MIRERNYITHIKNTYKIMRQFYKKKILLIYAEVKYLIIIINLQI